MAPWRPSSFFRSGSREAILALAILGAITILPRLRIILSVPGALDADESVILLMAKRISEGRDLPVFHYGNAYLGSLDAILAAAFMRLGGVSAITGRMVPLLLSVALAITVFLLGRRVGGSTAGWIAGLCTAAGPALLVIWGSKLHLGYLDIVILGNLLFLLVLRDEERSDPAGEPAGGAGRTMRGPRGRLVLVFAAGLIAGLGLWCHLLFLPYIVSALLFVLARRAGRGVDAAISRFTRLREITSGAAGFLLGSLPLVLFNLAHRGATLQMITRGAGSDGGLPVAVASSLYNLVTVVLPAVAGGAAPWAFYRVEFAFNLPRPLAAAVLFAAAVALSLAVSAAIGIRTDSRRRSVAAPAFFVLALASAVCLAVFIAMIDWKSGAWAIDPGLPPLPFTLLLDEITSAPMLGYLIYLPLLLLPAACARAVARRDPGDGGILLLSLHAIVSCCFYIFTSYGALRSPRFMFPLYSSLPVLFALAMIEMNRRWRGSGWVWTACVLAFHAGTLLSFPPIRALQPVHYVGGRHVPFAYQDLVRELDAIGARGVYATYWVGFPVAFESGERIAVSTGRPGRVPEFDRIVDADGSPAFVFLEDRFDEIAFRTLLDRAQVAHEVRESPPFRIYHAVDMGRLRSPSLWPQAVTLLNYP